MDIRKENIRFVLVLPSSHEAEDRFIYDIAFGVFCLTKRCGININDISVVIDNAPISKIELIFAKFGLDKPMKIYTTREFGKIIESNNKSNFIVFVTGHGSIEGLDSQNPLKPFPLYEVFQKNESLNRVFFFFGQCYAGIFNYLPLDKHLGIKNASCSIVSAGSTGLFPSVSVSVTIDGQEWCANIFLAFLFSWLVNPIDVDGDNETTIMDMFKFASIRTNDCLSKRKEQIDYDIYQLATSIKKDLFNPLQSELELKAIKTKLEIKHVMQEPWILNARIAMSSNIKM